MTWKCGDVNSLWEQSCLQGWWESVHSCPRCLVPWWDQCGPHGSAEAPQQPWAQLTAEVTSTLVCSFIVFSHSPVLLSPFSHFCILGRSGTTYLPQKHLYLSPGLKLCFWRYYPSLTSHSHFSIVLKKNRHQATTAKGGILVNTLWRKFLAVSFTAIPEGLGDCSDDNQWTQGFSKAPERLSSVFFNTLIIEESPKRGEQELIRFSLGHWTILEKAQRL